MAFTTLPPSAIPVQSPVFWGSLLLDYNHGLTIHAEHKDLYLCIILDENEPWYVRWTKKCSWMKVWSRKPAKDTSAHRFIFVPMLHSEGLDLATNKALTFAVVAERMVYIVERPFEDGHDVGTWTLPGWHLLTPAMLQTKVEDPAYMDARVTQWLCSFHSHPVRGSQCHCGQYTAEDSA